MLAIFPKVRKIAYALRNFSSTKDADSKYSADHGPLLHNSAGDVIQQKYSINRLCSKYLK